MAHHDGHPFAKHRAHHHERARVPHIAKGHAYGGAVHADAAEDRAMVKAMVKPAAIKHHKMHGGNVKHRSDRPHRAKGGRVKHGKTNVNVIVGHGAPSAAPMPVPVPAGPPPTAALPPRPPIVPPGPPMGGMAPPGPPMPMGPRHAGGRTYKRGGRVKPGPGWTESEKHKTPVQHTDGKFPYVHERRGKPITYKTGGAISSEHGKMSPHLPGGSGGGEARIAKERRARTHYTRPHGAHG